MEGEKTLNEGCAVLLCWTGEPTGRGGGQRGEWEGARAEGAEAVDRKLTEEQWDNCWPAALAFAERMGEQRGREGWVNE